MAAITRTPCCRVERSQFCRRQEDLRWGPRHGELEVDVDTGNVTHYPFKICPALEATQAEPLRRFRNRYTVEQQRRCL